MLFPIFLARMLDSHGGLLIDCQFETPHLRTMGGRIRNGNRFFKDDWFGVLLFVCFFLSLFLFSFVSLFLFLSGFHSLISWFIYFVLIQAYLRMGMLRLNTLGCRMISLKIKLQISSCMYGCSCRSHTLKTNYFLFC